MKKITLILFLFFSYSNLFSQIFVDNMIFRDIIKEKKEVKIDYDKLENYLVKYPYDKKGKGKKQGVYVAIKLFNNVFTNLQYISYHPILSIEKESVTIQNRQKILKSEILDYAIKDNGNLIEGAFLYRKLISTQISKYLPDIIVDGFGSRSKNYSYVIFDECLQKYNNFNYKSLITTNNKLDNSYAVKHQIYEDEYFYYGFLPMDNFITERDYNYYLSKINKQNIYSISIRYNLSNGFITRKGHSLINLKEKTKLQQYFDYNNFKFDSVSNLLYETTFQLDYNGQPKSENEKSIRIISFLYDNVVYKVVENFSGYSNAGRSLKKLPQLFYSNNEKVSLKKATEIQSKINDLYLDELKKMLFKEKFILLKEDNHTIFRNAKSLEFTKEGHNIDFVYYYDKTTITIKNAMGVIGIGTGENGFTNIKYNSTIYYEFDFDTSVAKNSDENIKIDDNNYDKKIIEKYYNRIQELNKKVCESKKINGEYINQKCRYYVENVKF